jgi:hypothetical protein
MRETVCTFDTGTVAGANWETGVVASSTIEAGGIVARLALIARTLRSCRGTVGISETFNAIVECVALEGSSTIISGGALMAHSRDTLGCSGQMGTVAVS